MKKITQITKYSFVAMLLLAFTSNSVFAFSSYDYSYGGDDISSYDYNYGGDSVSSYDYNYGGDYVASYYYDGYDGYNDYYTDDYYYDNDCYDCGSNYYPTPNYVYTPSTYVYTNNNGGCTNCGGSNPPRQDRLDVRCEVSDSTVEEGERVEFTVDVDGGDSPFDYEWSGDVDGDDRTISERFNREGRYTARITVTDDDGNRASDTCSVRVEEEDRDGSISVTSTTGLSNPNLGNPAVSSVYLSQVPYTGAGDTLMFMLWSIVGLLLTIGIVSKARKASYRKQVETRVEQFKEANRTIA